MHQKKKKKNRQLLLQKIIITIISFSTLLHPERPTCGELQAQDTGLAWGKFKETDFLLLGFLSVMAFGIIANMVLRFLCVIP